MTRRGHTRLESELLRSVAAFLNAATEFLKQKTEDLQEGVFACQRCKTERKYNDLDEGLCPKCVVQRTFDRRIQHRLLPTVRTVGGMARFGQDWMMEQP